MTPPSRQCRACKHFKGLEDEPGQGRVLDADEVATCTAFPEGIPKAISEERFDHRRPYPGDGGVGYEPAWDGAEEQLAVLFG